MFEALVMVLQEKRPVPLWFFILWTWFMVLGGLLFGVLGTR